MNGKRGAGALIQSHLIRFVFLQDIAFDWIQLEITVVLHSENVFYKSLHEWIHEWMERWVRTSYNVVQINV